MAKYKYYRFLFYLSFRFRLLKIFNSKLDLNYERVKFYFKRQIKNRIKILMNLIQF